MKRGELDGWVTSLIAAGSTFSTINDMEMQFLEAQGYTTGSLPDRWFNYLRGKGYTGSLQDMWQAAEAADDLLGPGTFDINTLYADAATYGDFCIAGVDVWQDSLQTTIADTAGQPVGWCSGQRTVGTNRDFQQATIANRPELATDATYGLVHKHAVASNHILSVGGYDGTARPPGAGLTFGVRLRLETDNLPSISRGVGFGDDFSPANAILGRIRSDGSNKWFWGESDSAANRAISATPAFSTDWVTLVGTINASRSEQRLYVNDPDTPVAEISTSTGFTPSRLNLGHLGTATMGTHYYRKWFHIEGVVPSVADVMNWLEA